MDLWNKLGLHSAHNSVVDKRAGKRMHFLAQDPGAVQAVFWLGVHSPEKP